MKKAIVILILSLPMIIHGQEGIKFEQGLTWEQIKQKAKTENKYIFVDASASWCVPCKKMDKEVFPLKNVGDYINEHFISVHVQMDTAKNDDAYIQSWYEDAAQLKNEYKVKAFPSYLFFSPDGKIVHRYLYSLSDTDLLKVARNALIPEKQYYSLLNSYNNKTIDKSKLSYLATVTKQIGDDTLANVIAKDYLHNYLNKLPEKDLLQKKHFDFLNTFSSLLTSNDSLFMYMYRQGSKVDAVMNQKDFAKFIVERTITREEITPKLKITKSSIEPNWRVITSSIQKKYSKWYADKLVLDAQLGWYKQKKDVQQIIKYRVKQIDNYGMDTTGISWALLNNFVWDYIFTYCNNKDTLNKAAHWMELIIQNHPDDFVSYDTYANVLYKAGRKGEAIKWEEKAAQMETEAAKKEKRDVDVSFEQALDKMKKGIATWGTK